MVSFTNNDQLVHRDSTKVGYTALSAPKNYLFIPKKLFLGKKVVNSWRFLGCIKQVFQQKNLYVTLTWVI